MAAIGGLVMAGSLAVAQEIYQWTDEQGRRHLSNVPPPGSDAEAFAEPEDTPEGPDHSAAADHFVTSVDSVLASLEASVIRKERALGRAQVAADRLRERLYDLQGELRTAGSGLDDAQTPPALPGTILRLTDEQERHQRKVTKLETEIAELKMKVEELRTIKLSGHGDLESINGFDR